MKGLIYNKMRRLVKRVKYELSLKTQLNSWHKEKKGKMVEFTGYEMPVQYEGLGVLKEHLHCRSKCSLFDVSHMG